MRRLSAPSVAANGFFSSWPLVAAVVERFFLGRCDADYRD